ncbi:MAG TPA: glutathione S-transferase family protein [Dongiaceae bacterium]|jgi:glutathione S-transferase
MTLRLYYHPLSSFCQKALIALYETGAPFTPQIVDLRDEKDRAAFLKLWPVGKFPVLKDETRDRLVPESSIIIEYLAQHYPGKATLVPADADAARQTRLRDRFFDLYLNTPMQKVVGDRMRPADKKDPFGVDHAKEQIKTAAGMLDQEMGSKTWIMGENFTLADCAAAPALFYAEMVAPFMATHKNVAAYFQRLTKRPSYARVQKEAEPYLKMVPQ